MALRMWLVLVNVALLSVAYGLSNDKSADQVLKTIEKLVTDNQKNQEVIARLMSDRKEDRKELQHLREEVRKLSQTVDSNKKVRTLLDTLSKIKIISQRMSNAILNTFSLNLRHDNTLKLSHVHKESRENWASIHRC